MDLLTAEESQAIIYFLDKALRERERAAKTKFVGVVGFQKGPPTAILQAARDKLAAASPTYRDHHPRADLARENGETTMNVIDRLRRPPDAATRTGQAITDRARESQLAGLIDERHKRADEGNRAEVLHCSEQIAGLLGIPLEAARRSEPPITPRIFKFGMPGTPEGISTLRPRRRVNVSAEPDAAMSLLALLEAVLRAQNPASDDPLRSFRASLVDGILGADPAEPGDEPPAPIGSSRGGPIPMHFRTEGLDGSYIVGPDGERVPRATAGVASKAAAPVPPLADEHEVEDLLKAAAEAAGHV